MYFNMRKLKLIFAWLMILMAMLACKSSSMEREDAHISCQDHFYKKSNGEVGVKASNCTYTCDNDTVLSRVFDENTPPEQSEILFYCNQPAASVAEESVATEPPTEEVPTEAPTDAPTEAPTEAPSAEPPAPILTGDVTYCDIVSRSVNLRLVEGFSAEEFSHQVTIGGEAMSCKVNEGNATLLTCTFPATTKFPASIQVSKDGNVVNEFEYNGSNCVVPEQQAGPKDPGSGEETSSGSDGSDCWDLYVPFGLCIPKP